MRSRLTVLAVVGLVCTLATMWFLRGPANPDPRSGRVLEGGVLVAYSPAYRVSFFGFERLHPFDIGKLDRIVADLQSEGLLTPGDWFIPPAISDAQLEAVHDPAYLASLHDTPELSRALEVGVPDIFPRSVVEGRVRHAFRKAVGGTELAVAGALEHGVGINIGGGFHHARPALGHGFCIYNDVAYGIARARANGFDGRVLIIDTDAHQGDGNHAMYADDPRVTTVSLHGGHLFPHPKIPGDVDVELASGVRYATFESELRRVLAETLTEPLPDLVIHVAGSDVLHDDPLADLGLTIDDLVARDALVMRAARDRDIPFVHLLAGGYGPSSALAQSRSVANLIRLARNSTPRD